MLQLYDLAGLYFRAFYALPSSIVGPHGRPVNAIRGTVDMLARVIAAARPERAVACLDADWRPAWRVALVPSYKTHRVAVGLGMTVTPATASAAAVPPAAAAAEALPDGLAWQVPVILDVLGAIGIATAEAPDSEADDVIGTLVDAEWSAPIEVVSGDRDLFQLIRAEPAPVAVRYIGGGMGKAVLMDERLLAERYGVDGAGYAALATLRGDPSDGLPGVPGIGEKTAARLVAEYGSIGALIRAAADAGSSLSGTVRDRVAGAADYLRAAARVSAVRRDAPVEMTVPAGDDRLPRLPADPARLDAIVREHGIGTAVGRLCAALADR